MSKIENISWPEWETVKLIGRGSFGEVYLIQRKIFGDIEYAALKVLSIPQNESEIEEMYGDGYDDESITGTFYGHLQSIVAEYSLMRKMKGCTNIVSCDDVRYVQHDDGFGWDIFIKMELLTPLMKLKPAENLEEMVIKLGRDICNALIACKEYGIVHRDIKPQNIFISKYGDYKLGDFGIAKTVERTVGGTKIGTYRYMAPEVYNNQPYGSTADICSLGLVMYWLLNEHRMPFLPLPPEKINGDMETEARQRRFKGEQLPPPAYGSEDLKKIVLKACAYDPKDRYATAAEMLRDLNEGFTDEETLRKREEERLRKEAEERKRAEEERLRKEAEERKRAEEERLRKEAEERKKAEEERLNAEVEKQKEDKKESSIKKEKRSSQKKWKKWNIVAIASVAVLILLLIILSQKNVGTPKKQTIDVPNKQSTEKNEEQSGEKPNWKNIDGEVYCYIGGDKLIGWNTIEGDRYFFDQNGIMQTGWATLGGEDHYFAENGVWQPDYLKNVVAIGGAKEYFVAVKADGTVVYKGSGDFLEQTKSWKDIVAVSAASTHVIGLKSDGTVVAAASKELQPCDVYEWNNIVKIGTCDSVTMGLKSDGTVVATETTTGVNVSEVNKWSNVTDISVGNRFIFACTENGTVFMAGSTCSWENIKAVSVGDKHAVGLLKNGTARAGAEGDLVQCNVNAWSDLVAISAGKEHTVGLKSDGTVVAVGENKNGQCNVADWKGIATIHACDDYTLGVTNNGEVLCTKKIIITSQPKSVSVAKGSVAGVAVDAIGTGLTYQWYYKDAGKTAFSKTSCTTSRYALTMDTQYAGRQVYCVVTDQYGNTATSKTVTLYHAAAITAQPQNACVAGGKTAAAAVTAVGEGLTYQWYCKDPGKTTFSKTSCTASRYAMTMSSEYAGCQVYCVVTDRFGKTATSDTVTLHQKATVTAQPKNVCVAAGKTAAADVQAVGADLTYQWYYKDPGKTTFSKTSCTTSRYSLTMGSKYAGRQIYCVVTDKYDNTAKSNVITLHHAAAITTQPTDVTVAAGSTAKVAVKAVGSGLTYQWYCKAPGGTKFAKASCTESSYALTMSSKVAGRQAYCVVTDQFGNTVTSNVVTLKMK